MSAVTFFLRRAVSRDHGRRPPIRVRSLGVPARRRQRRLLPLEDDDVGLPPALNSSLPRPFFLPLPRITTLVGREAAWMEGTRGVGWARHPPFYPTHTHILPGPCAPHGARGSHDPEPVVEVGHAPRAAARAMRGRGGCVRVGDGWRRGRRQGRQGRRKGWEGRKEGLARK